MSRPTVLTSGFHHYAQPTFEGIGHGGVSFRPLPARPDLPAAYHNHNHSQHHTGHYGRTAIANARMPSGSAYLTPDEDELAHFQKLSNEYQPEAVGPLVGERQSSAAITTEYANADPVYRIKTAALPAQYAFFRTCRGDGHCGWRAIAFTYYEALLRVGDANRIEEEEARLHSMHNLLNLAGFVEDVYIDFAEEVYDLHRKLADSLRVMDGAAPTILLQTFNDMGCAMAIITYFKLLASAWIQSHPNEFQPFLEMDVKTYCSFNIEPAQCEIDHCAIVALVDAVVKPAGFALEVNYLDRSPGEKIDTHRYDPDVALANPPTLRLLYRPGHYDILYKAEDVAAPLQQPQPVQAQPPLHVALAAGYPDEFVPMSNNMSDVMTMIPGMSFSSLSDRWPSVPYDYSPTAAPQPQMAPVTTYAPVPTPALPVTSSHQEYVTPVRASHANHHHSSHHGLQLESPVTLPIHTARPLPPASIERSSMTLERGGPFRPSIYEFEPGYGSGQPHALPFQTSIFRNSHYNTAHFLNPDFQPEEWSPDAEYATNRARHKSTLQ